MLWLLIDLALAVLALVVLGLVAFGLYRKIRRLARAAGATGALLEQASADLAVVQPSRSSPASRG